jgi:hypothetical protein
MAFDRRRLAGYAAAVFAITSALLALVAWFTGGFRVYVFGIPLSARGEHRAALFAAILAVVAVLLLDRERRIPGAAIAGIRQGVAWLRRRRGVLKAFVPIIPVSVGMAVLYVGIALGARAAGGSDTYGYVSQAKLWLKGDLRVTRTELTEVPWPDGDWTFVPLGFRRSAPQTIVPTYSPGGPLLMAGAELVLGSCGPFLVTPICGALLVWLTYALGVRVSGRGVATLASVVVATSPMVLMLTVWPMSDGPAATFWTASLVLAGSRHASMSAASGAAAGIAILIRPNLAPLAAGPLAMCVWPWLRGSHAGSRWTRVRLVAVRAAAFAMACLPAIAFIGWLFNDLYGSPLESGYGRTADLYAWTHLPANIVAYPRRLLLTHGPIPFLFLLTPFLGPMNADEQTGRRWLLLAFVAATVGAYALYMPFDEWWYLRFLLPAFPALFVLAFDAIMRLRSRIGGVAGSGVAVVLTSLALYQGTAFTIDRDIIHVAEGEQKYADAGRYVANSLPSNSIVLAMQHSGNVRLYSGRLTLRYDILPPAWLDRALDHLRREGYEPYLLLEDWEVERFRERFAGQQGAALVDLPPLAAMPDRKVLLFAGDPSQRGPGTAIMPRTHGCRTAW